MIPEVSGNNSNVCVWSKTADIKEVTLNFQSEAE